MGEVERREWLKHRVYKLKHYDRHYDRHESGYSVMIYHENITIGSTRVYLGLWTAHRGSIQFIFVII